MRNHILDFLGNPQLTLQASITGGVGSIPDAETKIPQATLIIKNKNKFLKKIKMSKKITILYAIDLTQNIFNN